MAKPIKIIPETLLMLPNILGVSFERSLAATATFNKSVSNTNNKQVPKTTIRY